MFLIYETEKEAWNRSEEEGIRIGLSYHRNGIGSRYVTPAVETADGKFALDVKDFLLTEEEAMSTVSSFEIKTISLPDGLI